MPTMPPMPWVRLDYCAQHPKMWQLVEDDEWRAIAVWHFALPWCGQNGTAGFVPGYALAAVHGTVEVATKLVEVGLWEPVPGGWYVHDWDHYQPTGPEAAKRREKAQKAAQARWAKHQASGGDHA